MSTAPNPPTSDEPRPATDLLLADLAQCVKDVREHDHPYRDDFYCPNLVAYMGERMGSVLKRLADEQAAVRNLKDRLNALADEATTTTLELARVRPVVDAARAYYWHNDESGEFHNDLMDEVDSFESSGGAAGPHRDRIVGGSK